METPTTTGSTVSELLSEERESKTIFFQIQLLGCSFPLMDIPDAICHVDTASATG